MILLAQTFLSDMLQPFFRASYPESKVTENITEIYPNKIRIEAVQCCLLQEMAEDHLASSQPI